MSIYSPTHECILTSRKAAIGALAILMVQAGLLAWAATLHSPTWDEPAYLASGVSHWRSGWFDSYRVNPPLVRLVVTWPAVIDGVDINWERYRIEPWFRPEFDLGDTLIAQYGERSLWYIFVCRWAALPFATLGGWVCFAWARQLYGERAGLVAVTLWATSPNVMAHAQLITPDTAAAAFGVLACYAFWNWLNWPSWQQAMTTGVALGVALLTKFTMLVLPPLWVMFWVCCCIRHRTVPAYQLMQLGTACGVSLLVVNAGYGFEDTFWSLDRFQFVSRDMAGEPTGRHGCPNYGNRFAGTWLGRLPVPIPANYLMGIDVQRRDFELGLYSYLAGEWRRGGWWYYYLYGLAVKETLGSLMLVILASVSAVFSRPSARLFSNLLPLVCCTGIVAFVSSQTGFNHHVRYVLPALPLAYIFASRVFAVGRSRLLTVVGAVCVVTAVTSSLAAYPHSLSYFNELAGGARSGSRHLHNSNLDWGQDLLFLKAWCDRYPDRRPLYIVYSGGFDSKHLQIWGEGVYHTSDPETYKAIRGDVGQCWCAIFIGEYYRRNDSQDIFTNFRDQLPVEIISDTVYIFQIK
jgi:hypothetical protein